MECKYCGLPMPDDAMFCPYCGKNNHESSADVAAQMEALLEEDGEAVIFISSDGEFPEEEGFAEAESLEAAEDFEEEEDPVEEAAASPEVKKMKRMAMISGCAAVLVLLGTLLFFLVRGEAIDIDFKQIFWVREDTLLGNETYSVSDRKAYSKRNQVVATLGDAELTNGHLQVYYWMEVYNFLNEYGAYASYFGLDYTKPLDEQMSIEGNGTWQQYFLQTALEAWQRDQSFVQEAKKAGFQMDADYREMLDGLMANMETTAKQEGYESADAYIQASMGPGCTAQDYVDYLKSYYTCSLYFGELYGKINPTPEEVDAYFENNKDAFAEDKITKESGKYYTVRHVYIKITGGTKDEEGKLVYSDADWEVCREKAQAIYDSWMAGDQADESSFGDIAQKHSEDTSTNKSGGLIENFIKDKMNTSYGQDMEDWCVSEDRQEGDHALIKGTGGYHIVYFVENQDIWYKEARDGYISSESAKLVENALKNYTLEADYKKIVLGVVDLG